MRGETQALPWAAWGLLAGVLVVSTTNLVVLGVTIVVTLASMSVLGGTRRAAGIAAVGIALCCCAVWVVFALVVHRDGVGGSVVWVLPSWEPESGGSFGGAVTTGQLLAALVRAAQAAAVVLIVGLLYQAVSADAWLRLGTLVLGGAAAAVAPVACLGQAYSELHQERVLLRGDGFDRARSGPPEVVLRSRQLATSWSTDTTPAAGRWRDLAGLVVITCLTAAWAATVITGPKSGVEITVILIAALVVLGCLLRPEEMSRPHAADLAPTLAAAALLAAWCLRTVSGDAAGWEPAATEVPTVPLVSMAALVALPMLLLADRRRR